MHVVDWTFICTVVSLCIQLCCLAQLWLPARKSCVCPTCQLCASAAARHSGWSFCNSVSEKPAQVRTPAESKTVISTRSAIRTMKTTATGCMRLQSIRAADPPPPPSLGSSFGLPMPRSALTSPAAGALPRWHEILGPVAHHLEAARARTADAASAPTCGNAPA